MKQPVGRIAVEGKHIVRDFRLGTATTRVLRDISLQVMKGEFVSIMGPSGSGKSTLLYILGGLDNPTSGCVLLDGTDISRLGDEQMSRIRRQKIGFVFQFYNLIPNLSGGQQQRVAIARALIGKPEILFADEPTGNLDSKTGAEIMKLLREINQGTGQTIIMVTHSMEAAGSSTRMLTVQDGLIL